MVAPKNKTTRSPNEAQFAKQENGLKQKKREWDVGDKPHINIDIYKKSVSTYGVPRAIHASHSQNTAPPVPLSWTLEG